MIAMRSSRRLVRRSARRARVPAIVPAAGRRLATLLSAWENRVSSTAWSPAPMARVPVAEGVFTWPSDDPRLIGSRCAACGIVTFPAQASCPRCASTGHGGAPAAAARAGSGRGRPRSSRRRRPRMRDRRATRSSPTGGLRGARRRGEGRDAPHGDDGAADRAWTWSSCWFRSAPTSAATRSSPSPSGRCAEPAHARPVHGGSSSGRRDRGGGAASVRPLRGCDGDRDGRDRHPARPRGRGRRVARHPVRVRRELRDRQPRRGGRAARAHGDPVHQRLQRLRDRGERPRAGRRHDPPRRARARPRGRHGQAPPRARSVPTRACTRARRGTASSATSSPRSSSG